LKVGRPSAELAEWFQTNNENQAAYITAWNPFGKKISDNENYIAEHKLITEIESRDLFYLRGESSDPSGSWPGEPSLLVLGISLESAKALVKRYHQDGFIYIGDDTKPQLILLR
jgi:5'-3' exonuclease